MPEIIRGGGYGARVTAYVGLLSSQYRQSYRQIQQLMQAVFGLEMSIGTINRLRIEVSEAVSDAVTEAQSYIQHSPTVGVDETGFNPRNGDGQNAAPDQRLAVGGCNAIDNLLSGDFKSGKYCRSNRLG